MCIHCGLHTVCVCIIVSLINTRVATFQGVGKEGVHCISVSLLQGWPHFRGLRVPLHAPQFSLIQGWPHVRGFHCIEYTSVSFRQRTSAFSKNSLSRFFTAGAVLSIVIAAGNKPWRQSITNKLIDLVPHCVSCCCCCNNSLSGRGNNRIAIHSYA